MHTLALVWLCVLSSCSDAKEKDSEAADQSPHQDDHPVVAKLNQIVIPNVDFAETAIEDALDFARMRSIVNDPEKDPTRKGVSLILQMPMQEGPLENEHDLGIDSIHPTRRTTITYKAENVRYLDLIAEIARQVGLDAYLTSVGIIVVPEKQLPFPNAKAEQGEIWKTLRRATETKGEQDAGGKRE